MIHPSKRWRFVQEIEDAGYYEDDIVQHLVTEHRAIRRSYSEKFSADAVAASEVRKQLALAGSCNPPALPVIYAIEEVRGRLTYIMEMIAGVEVGHLVRQKQFMKPRPWCDFAIKLVDELMLLRKADARFDKLPIDHLVIVDTGELRIRQRLPVGPLDPETVGRSRFLPRFGIVARGGVYTDRNEHDEAGELEAIREILVKAAAANTSVGFDELRQEALAAPEKHSSPLARVDATLAEFLFHINVGRSSADVRTLEQLRSRLLQLRDDLVAQARQNEQPAWATQAPVEAAPSKPAPARAAFNPDEPADNPFLHKPPADFNVDESPAQSSFAGATRREPPAESKPRAKRPDPPPLSIDEDVNPFSANVAPTPGPDTRPTSKAPAVSSAVLSTAKPAKPRGPLVSPALIRAGAMALLAIGAIVVLALVVPPLLRREPSDKTPPVAALADSSPRNAAAEEKIPLDASPSSDDLATSLSYQWTVAAPAGSKALFGDASGGQVSETNLFLTRNPRIFVQFLNPGEYQVELRVNDGRVFSDPVLVSITISR